MGGGRGRGPLTRVSASAGDNLPVGQINSCANVLTRQRRSAPGRSVHRQTQGARRLSGGPPLFPSLHRVSKIPIILFYLPSVTRGGSRLSNASSSHRPYGVRRQTFWQRPPFGAPLLVQISGCVTSLGGPAMHIFSGLVHFGQLCSGECKSAVRSAVILAVASAFHRSPG